MIKTDKIISLVGFIIAVIAGFLAWFAAFGTAYSLIDGYNTVIHFIAIGGGNSFGPGFGTLIHTSSSSFALTIIGLVITLIFWPATVIGGIVEVATKSTRVYPGIYGVIAFLSSILTASALSRSNGTTAVTLGIGVILILISAILFFIAFSVDVLERRKKRQAEPVPRTGPPIYPCPICGLSFSSKSLLDEHTASAHPQKPGTAA